MPYDYEAQRGRDGGGCCSCFWRTVCCVSAERVNDENELKVERELMLIVFRRLSTPLPAMYLRLGHHRGLLPVHLGLLLLCSQDFAVSLDEAVAEKAARRRGGGADIFASRLLS